MSEATSPKDSPARTVTAAEVAPITHPTREDAERLLAKALNTVRRIMRNELEAEQVSTDLMNFHMKAR